MTTSVQIIAIINLSIMVICLAGFIVYQLDNHQRTRQRWARRIEHLNDMLVTSTETKMAASSSQKNPQDDSVALQAHQVSILNAALDLEDRVAQTDPKTAAKLTAQINTLKAQATQAYKLSEQFGQQAKSSLHRQLALETKLELKQGLLGKAQATLYKAQATNRELKGHYDKVTVAYKQMLQRIAELRETKDQLTQAAGENVRLNAAISEFHRLHENQLATLQGNKDELQNRIEAVQADSVESFLDLENQLSTLQEQFDRNEVERNFLEQQFLEVVGSLDSKELVEGELYRTKQEYSLLSDHFLELAEADTLRNANNEP
ncbi:hypothetical protein [Reinekea sp.]|uniref:hypothetical protein n=1 Tax=Reinekea sp. TaxID=1970455 RepID=UPI002A805976|nr:hypothetical protein [Reinekea sp.]